MATQSILTELGKAAGLRPRTCKEAEAARAKVSFYEEEYMRQDVASPPEPLVLTLYLTSEISCFLHSIMGVRVSTKDGSKV